MDAATLLKAAQAHPGSVELPDGGHGTYCLVCGEQANVTPDGTWTCRGDCDPEQAVERYMDWYQHTWLPAQNDNKPARIKHEVTWDNTKKPPKPVLPPAPDANNPVDQAGWVTAVLHLSTKDPIVTAHHQGLFGSGGHIELRRLGGKVVRFEPASKIGKALTLAEELVWQLAADDGDPYPWTNQQTIKIARVIRLLCGSTRNLTARDEAEYIVNALVDAGEETVGHTYKTTTGQRHKLAVLLRPALDDHGRPIRLRYLIDIDTGEYVMRVSDLRKVARDLVGNVPHGWLDARMETLGWERCRFQGYGLPRSDVEDRGPHARVDVFRGFLTVGE